MDELINIVNKLQEVFNASGHNVDVDLPQVVVVGTQSSGKSSVLEHLVGKSFLPRGSGIVTRCPLIMQLTKSNDEEYAVFQHDSSKIFTDYTLICKEIERQTEQLAGDNKGICSTPIILKLYSPSHLDLTLVDLPGLTKVPVGDQPPDIDEQTRDLTLEYVKNPKSIILAVIPANTDMATSESLKISRDVDPEGVRTLAVVTKLDIMDRGTNAVDILSGNVIPVKLGIIGVVNRSQKDINAGKSITDSLKDEAAFLKRRYEDIASQHGTPYLMKTVQRILIEHIKTSLPELKDSVSQHLAKKRVQLKAVSNSKLDRSSQMLEFITKFTRNYSSTVNGDLDNIKTSELWGGARINYVFNTTLSKALDSIEALEGLSKSAVSTAILNASGVKPALFPPQLAFELLVIKQMKRLRGPCLECIELVQEELKKIKRSCLQDKEVGLRKYPQLQQEISATVEAIISDRLPITREMVNNMMDIEFAYINTAHPDFSAIDIMKMSLKRKYLKEKKKMSDSDIDERKEEKEDNYNLMVGLIESYFSIVRTSIQDKVTKTIMHFLVNYVLENLEVELVMKLYKCDAEHLLEESPQVIAERTRLESEIARLECADDILRSF